MSYNKTYAVLGLGRYGIAVAKELVRSGAEVLAIDIDQDVVNAAIAEVPYCKCADITDMEVMKHLGINNVDVAIIGISEKIDISVMAVMNCKELGVPTVIAKCATEMECKILEKVGADQVVFPEQESGTRLAKNMISNGFMDIMDLSDDATMVEFDVKDSWAGKTLIELDFRNKFGANIIAILQNGKMDINVDPNKPLQKSMSLIVIANPKMLEKMKKVK